MRLKSSHNSEVIAYLIVACLLLIACAQENLGEGQDFKNIYKLQEGRILNITAA